MSARAFQFWLVITVLSLAEWSFKGAIIAALTTPGPYTARALLDVERPTWIDEPWHYGWRLTPKQPPRNGVEP